MLCDDAFGLRSWTSCYMMIALFLYLMGWMDGEISGSQWVPAKDGEDKGKRNHCFLPLGLDMPLGFWTKY